jgi:hypothetical protein
MLRPFSAVKKYALFAPRCPSAPAGSQKFEGKSLDWVQKRNFSISEREKVAQVLVNFGNSMKKLQMSKKKVISISETEKVARGSATRNKRANEQNKRLPALQTGKS